MGLREMQIMGTTTANAWADKATVKVKTTLLFEHTM